MNGVILYRASVYWLEFVLFMSVLHDNGLIDVKLLSVSILKILFVDL